MKALEFQLHQALSSSSKRARAQVVLGLCLATGCGTSRCGNVASNTLHVGGSGRIAERQREGGANIRASIASRSLTPTTERHSRYVPFQAELMRRNMLATGSSPSNARASRSIISYRMRQRADERKHARSNGRRSEEGEHRKDGEPLGALFSALWQEVAVLHFHWKEYVELFGTKPERIALLNRAAPHFFRMLQDELWESTLLLD